MRFKSSKVGGYQIFAITGTNTVSFGIDCEDADTKGLLGFAVERSDPKENQKYYMFSFKVFPSVIRHPDKDTHVKTYDHPVQSFVWDDFTAKDGHKYIYTFHPLKGKPKNLDRTASPIEIDVETEPLYSDLEHDVFFNRGVASSQAYAREFNNKSPSELDKTDKAEAQRARDWLSRQLDEALLKFIGNAKKGDGLLCCFYEFRYAPAAKALQAAIKRGVDVRIIFDAKVNGTKDDPSFPRTENLKTVKDAKIPKSAIILREAKPNSIQHNKFMVLLKGKKQKPSEVWTGSTNLSDGGVHGQTNVGHWVRNAEVAAQFKAYWELLSGDPGPKAKAAKPDVLRENKELRATVDALTEAPESIAKIRKGVTAVFSPRSELGMLKLYAQMVDSAKKVACITLAFGISAVFKDLLKDNTKKGHISFFLLEKEDKKNPKAKTEFVKLNASQNVYKAWGAYLPEPLYQWVKEKNTRALGLNKHVSYIHSKFLLMDPLSAEPIVVTGSANFSAPSTTDNDENMLIIRGDRRVADIYFTEFNRLFYHYYFRSVQETTRRLEDKAAKAKSDQTLFLDEDDGWVGKYKKGSLKWKRIQMFKDMDV